MKAGSRFRFFAALLSVLAVTVVAGVLIYQTAFDTLRRTFRELLERSVTRGTLLLDGYIQSQFTQLSLYASSPSVQRGLLDELKPGIEDRSVPSTRPRRVAIIDSRGHGISTTGQRFEAVDMPYFQDALGGKRSLTGPFVSRSENLPVVVFALPVPGRHPEAAVITSVVDLRVLHALLESIRTLPGSEFSVLQESGLQVVGSDPAGVVGERIEARSSLKNVSWTLTAKVGLADLMAPVRSVLLVIGLLVATGVIFTVVFFLIGLSHRRRLDQVREDRTQALRDAYEQNSETGVS